MRGGGPSRHQRNSDNCASRNSESGSTARALPRWAAVFKRTASADAALKCLPEGLWAERRMLIAFSKLQNFATSSTTTKPQISYYEQCRYAFLCLPRSLRVLYTHAYLDRIWNLACSQRIEFYGGDKVVVGDLVLVDAKNDTVTLDNSSTTGTKKEKVVKIIRTAEECEQYSIFDVVLPRLGHDHLWSSGEDGTSEHGTSSTTSTDDTDGENDCRDPDARAEEDAQESSDSPEDSDGDGAETEEVLVPEQDFQNNQKLPALLPTHEIGQIMKHYLSYDDITELKVELRLAIPGILQFSNSKSSRGSREAADHSASNRTPSTSNNDFLTFECERDWRVPGDYRYIVAKPTDLEWSFETTRAQASSATRIPAPKRLKTDGDVVQQVLPTPSEEWVVKTGFSLGAGQYATMLMRELLLERRPPPPRCLEFDSDSD